MEDNKEGKIEKKDKVKKTEEEMTGTELMQEMINLDPDDEDEVSMKAYLLERVFYSFVLPFYDKGILLFFEEDDKLFCDKVLISTYSEGESKEHSEKMGIDMKKHFVIDEYVLLPKSSIKFFEISQNTCPNPELFGPISGTP